MDKNVDIIDEKDKRIVVIKGPHYEYRGFVREDVRFEVFYSKDLIREILKVKGKRFLKDEIDRSEDPRYVRNPVVSLIDRFTKLEDGSVLDFGSGCGASSISLARSYKNIKVIGVEIDENDVKVAKKRAFESGISDRVEFVHLKNTMSLPFEKNQFRAIICSAVIEHIYPEQRKAHLRELWRVLNKGGFLFIDGTPNRLWPKDGHTTNLWFVPYMPLPMACWFARNFSQKIDSAKTKRELLKMGVRGETYWGIINKIRGIGRKFREMNKYNKFAVDDYFKNILCKYDKGIRNKVVVLLKNIYKAADLIILKPLSIPVCAFFPYLVMCLNKAED